MQDVATKKVYSANSLISSAYGVMYHRYDYDDILLLTVIVIIIIYNHVYETRSVVNHVMEHHWLHYFCNFQII